MIAPKFQFHFFEKISIVNKMCFHGDDIFLEKKENLFPIPATVKIYE
jgi:hypothetical protein